MEFISLHECITITSTTVRTGNSSPRVSVENSQKILVIKESCVDYKYNWIEWRLYGRKRQRGSKAKTGPWGRRWRSREEFRK